MCGFISYISDKDNVSDVVSFSLQAIQHRGQDSSGIAIASNNGNFTLHKDKGYVDKVLSNFKNNSRGIAIGHVRYPTIGAGTIEDAQPFFCRQPGIIMAHNGNIVNYKELEEELKNRSIRLSSKCDIEPVLYLLADELMKIRKKNHQILDVVVALKEVYKIVKGSFSIVAGMYIDGKPTMLCARDSFGIRPAVWGKTKTGDYMCASESVCFDLADVELMGDVPAGEVMFFRANEEPQQYVIQKSGNSFCTFEAIYFARPDSVFNNEAVYAKRRRLGVEVAREFRSKKFDIDMIVTIPDTSIPAALAMAETLNKPYKEGFIKNRYSARTFIMPDHKTRERALRLKLNPIASELDGKKILLTDDSIVRGSTLKRVISLLRNKTNVKEIHLAIHCPPVVHPCFYGIDISVQEDLIAYRHAKKHNITGKKMTLQEHKTLEVSIAKELVADSLTFLTRENMLDVFEPTACRACFTGEYPIEVNDSLRKTVIEDRTPYSSVI